MEFARNRRVAHLQSGHIQYHSIIYFSQNALTWRGSGRGGMKTKHKISNAKALPAPVFDGTLMFSHVTLMESSKTCWRDLRVITALGYNLGDLPLIHTSPLRPLPTPPSRQSQKSPGWTTTCHFTQSNKVFLIWSSRRAIRSLFFNHKPHTKIGKRVLRILLCTFNLWYSALNTLVVVMMMMMMDTKLSKKKTKMEQNYARPITSSHNPLNFSVYHKWSEFSTNGW